MATESPLPPLLARPVASAGPRSFSTFRFLRALLGMLVALALAAAIVAHEFHPHSSRTPGRLAQLQARIAAMQQRLAAANHALFMTTAELNGERAFDQLLAAPDSRLVRFTSNSAFSAIMAVNPRLMTGALEAHASPLPAQPCYIWWIRRGAPLRGPALSFDPHGVATLSIRLPLPPNQLDAIAIAALDSSSLAHPLARAALNASPR